MRLLVPLVLPLLPLSAAAEKKDTVGVDVSLVSENTAIAAGKPFRVGLKIHHHPKFHTYWQNPGIAGVPTHLEWKLPEGFSAGAIRWPYPEKTMMAIHPVHGYERDVMLVVDITPPAVLTGTKVSLQATASWMACADGCYPGRAKVEVTVPVSNQPEMDPAAETEFAKAAAEVPTPLEGWGVELLSPKDGSEIKFRLKPVAASTGSPGELYFFSTDGQVSSNLPQRMDVHPDGSLELTLKRSEQSPVGRPSLPGVLKSTIPLAKDGRTFASMDPAFPAE